MVNSSVHLLDKKQLYLPKLGRIRFKDLPQKIFSHCSTIRIGTTTIAMDATGRYYVSLQVAAVQPFVERTQVEKSPIGIDNFLTNSNGHVVANPRYYRCLQGKLAQIQRKLYGSQFIIIKPPQNCSYCGFVMGTGKTEKLTLRDREWTCPQCGSQHLRDGNAAQNILTKGLASI